jgi:acyl-CoA synthetase (AMP-forming)/AMP-acid ligase II
MTNESTVFTAMPLFHSTAALLGACAILSHGGCLALSHKFSASTFWKQVYLTGATHIQYVGEVCRYLLHTPISKYEKMHKVKVAYGNGLRPDIWQDFRKRFNIEVIGEFYAATEAPFATTTFQKGDFGIGACRNYGTIIQWFLSFQQTLVRMDPNDDSVIYRNSKGFCEVAPVGEPGEMLMRIFFPKKPETSFQGYLGNAKETKSKVVRDVFRRGDAWYRCGDLLKADEYGLWYFLDRMGDTFRWKSENVSTTEVEDQLTASNKEQYAQVLVVGIKVPKYEGRAGFAVIKLTDNSLDITAKTKLLNDSLSRLNLPSYAMPLFVKFVDEIKMTDNHKILKKVYREQKLPKGLDGNDTIFWLKNYKRYEVLTAADWEAIDAQTIKL